jgi:hypothetical protein
MPKQFPNNNKAGEMSEGKKEKCHTEKFLKRKREKNEIFGHKIIMLSCRW